jgi:hypothetical protein
VVGDRSGSRVTSGLGSDGVQASRCMQVHAGAGKQVQVLWNGSDAVFRSTVGRARYEAGTGCQWASMTDLYCEQGAGIIGMHPSFVNREDMRASVRSAVHPPLVGGQAPGGGWAGSTQQITLCPTSISRMSCADLHAVHYCWCSP